MAAIVAAYTLMLFAEERSGKTLLLHSLASGLLIGSRILGVYILVITIILVMLQVFGHRKKKQEFLGSIIYLGIYLILTYGITVLLMPVLWSNPINGIVDTFTRMANFPNPENVLYIGQYFNAQNLPWHYIPVWIAVTTPLLYTYYFLLGLFYGIQDTILSGIKAIRTIDYQYFLLLGWFFIPLIAVIVFHSTLYNSWRHMFLYLSSIFMYCIAGTKKSIQPGFSKFQSNHNPFDHSNHSGRLSALELWQQWSRIIPTNPCTSIFWQEKICVLSAFDTKWIMGQPVIVKPWKKYLLRIKVPTIPIQVTHLTGKRNAYLMLPEERQRLYYPTDESEVKYFIGDYRNRREDYSFGVGVNPWYSVSVDGVDLCVVYRLYH